MNKKKVIIIVVAAVLVASLVAAGLIFFLGRNNDLKPIEVPTEPTECIVEAPDTYEIDGVAVQAFPVGPDIQVVLDKPEEEGADEPTVPNETATDPSEETAGSVQPGIHVKAIYSYRDVTEIEDRVADYCEMLMREDIGFVPVDEGNIQIELPLIEPIGRVRLVHPEESGEGEEKQQWLFSLQLDWMNDGMNVVLARIDSTIQQPEEPVEVKKEPITLMEAMKIFEHCKPSELELPGESMDAYDIIMLDGSVMVGKEPFMRVNIYTKSPKDSTNIIAGMYLLSATGERMYRVDLNHCLYPLNFTAK